jgi:hypothetical protein
VYLFDTDYLSILKRQSGLEFEKLSSRLAEQSALDFFISIVSFHEQFQGWNAYLARASDESGVTRAYEQLENLLQDYTQDQVLPFDESAAELFTSFGSKRSAWERWI